MQLKTHSGKNDVVIEPDELGTPRLEEGKKPKARERKGKRTKRKESKRKKPEKREPETDKPKARNHDLPSHRPAPLPKLSPAEASVMEPSTVERISEPKEAKPFYVIGGVSGSRTDTGEDKLDEAGIPSPFSPTLSPSPQSSATGQGQGQYYLVFVNTLAQSLLKSKVQIDFDTFPTVTIGRDQENVVVIPDQNVSRLHAELSRDGKGVMLKDQQSTNGTYLYDGKEFQQVNDSVEIKPNSLIKFGSSTIVKLICE